MKLWIDGDSWPRLALETALRFSESKKINVEIVSDRSRSFKNIPNVRLSFVDKGKNAVDTYILKMAHKGDAVLTMDVHLAKELVFTGRIAMNHKGKIWKMGEIENRVDNAKIMYAMKKGGMIRRLKAPSSIEYNAALQNSLEQLLIT